MTIVALATFVSAAMKLETFLNTPSRLLMLTLRLIQSTPRRLQLDIYLYCERRFDSGFHNITSDRAVASLRLLSSFLIDKQCGSRVRPTRYAPAVCTLTFVLETGMRVAFKVGNLRSKFGHVRPFGCRIIRYVRDGRTKRQTDGWTKATLIAPFPTVEDIIMKFKRAEDNVSR